MYIDRMLHLLNINFNPNEFSGEYFIQTLRNRCA